VVRHKEPVQKCNVVVEEEEEEELVGRGRVCEARQYRVAEEKEAVVV